MVLCWVKLAYVNYWPLVLKYFVLKVLGKPLKCIITKEWQPSYRLVSITQFCLDSFNIYHPLWQVSSVARCQYLKPLFTF